MAKNLRVAIIGAGPAGIYAADNLIKSERNFDINIDIFEKYPAPYGLIRYGVAPDHPRIKGIVSALHKTLSKPEIRLIGNVTYGVDIDLTSLQKFYDAIIFSTGASKDAQLNIPGTELQNCFGAAEFVSWYDGLPEAPRQWDLSAKQIAVIGNGNVALDVARILAKNPEDLLSTEIPDNVYNGLKNSQATDIHVFGRRGPAQTKFTPLELRELGHLRDVDIVVYPEDFEFDTASMEAIHSHNQIKAVVNTLQNWTLTELSNTATRRLHLHFLQSPTEILGNDKVSGLKVERNTLNGSGNITSTGQFIEYPLEAVYRAVGYFGSKLPGLPFDNSLGIINNIAGRVISSDKTPIPGIYTTGWIKRGPVGLIGHTKSDASETVNCILEDYDSLCSAPERNLSAIIEFLENKNILHTNWEGWLRLNTYEENLGSSEGRERKKIVSHEDMLNIARGE